MPEAVRAYLALMAIGFRAAPWHAAFQLITGVIFAAAVPVAALGGKLIIDAAVEGDLALGMLATALLGVVVSAGLISVFYYVDCLFTVRERAGALVSRRLMELIGGADGLAHHERPEYLDQVHRIREEQDRLSAMVNATAGLLRVSVSLLVTGVLLALVHPVLLLLPALAVVSLWFGKRERDLRVRAQEETSEPERLRRHLFELGTSAAAAKELRIFGLVELIGERHHAVAQAVIRPRDRAGWRGAGLQALDGVVSALGFVAAITVALLMAVDGRATAGDVVLVAGLAVQLSGTVGTAVMYGTQLLFVLKVARRFLWLEGYAKSARAIPADPVELPDRLRHGIELRDVEFSYPEPGARRSVLSGVSLLLPAGAVVALVGDNGAGKTTLVKLLCGFYQPDRGQILVDGVDLRRFGAEGWQRRVSAAFQDFATLEFLARETVGVGDLARLSDDVAVNDALARAGAAQVVAGLPQELHTQLGARWEGGVDLSGGQWQRLALARGLMQDDPLLVVFDEPTAALDAHTEHALFERFAQAARTGRTHGTTTLLVSHRFSTVRMADLIVVLDRGRIREVGSHADLMARGDLYAELYGLQSRSYQ